MNHSQLHRVFQRHYGEATRLSAEIGIHKTTLSKWFRGHVTSAKIEAAVVSRAKELLQAEMGDLSRKLGHEPRSAA